jgi:hypothetical protein
MQTQAASAAADDYAVAAAVAVAAESDVTSQQNSRPQRSMTVMALLQGEYGMRAIRQ